jgi:glyceraldehyde-3-phosphate dehydrogenase/erythrose-4-phosphate dehydrogenase
VIEIIGRRIGIQKAIMTTFHAYTASQAIVDSQNKRLERGLTNYADNQGWERKLDQEKT